MPNVYIQIIKSRSVVNSYLKGGHKLIIPIKIGYLDIFFIHIAQVATCKTTDCKNQDDVKFFHCKKLSVWFVSISVLIGVTLIAVWVRWPPIIIRVVRCSASICLRVSIRRSRALLRLWFAFAFFALSCSSQAAQR